LIQAGLGGYVYLQRNPSIEAKAKAKLHDAKDEAKSKMGDLKGQAQAAAATATSGALNKSAFGPVS
jgi:hypothetical protein